nr:division/cell wall cluster transcriptional repressor MraZ [Thalassospira sp. TSL5-1]
MSRGFRRVLFTGTHIHKLDRKGRVSVPKRFRAALEADGFAGIYVYESPKEPTIEGCSESHMERIAASLDDMEMFSDEAEDLADTILGASHALPFDGEGRIILPPELIDYAGITDQVAFVGRGRTFRIWNPETFTDRKTASRTRLVNRGSTLKLKPASAMPARAAAGNASSEPDLPEDDA